MKMSNIEEFTHVLVDDPFERLRVLEDHKS